MNTAARTASFGRPLSSEEISVTSVATGVSAVPALAKGMLVSVTGQNARWRSDGTSPTASVGHVLEVGNYIEYGRAEIGSVEFIAETGTAVVFVTFYGE